MPNSTPRRPKNAAEAALFDLAAEEGWTATKRGWPDFFCFREHEDGSFEFFVVEVKPSGNTQLKAEQRRVLEALAAVGVPSYRWDPETGLEQVRR